MIIVAKTKQNKEEQEKLLAGAVQVSEINQMCYYKMRYYPHANVDSTYETLVQYVQRLSQLR